MTPIHIERGAIMLYTLLYYTTTSLMLLLHDNIKEILSYYYLSPLHLKIRGCVKDKQEATTRYIAQHNKDVTVLNTEYDNYK